MFNPQNQQLRETEKVLRQNLNALVLVKELLESLTKKMEALLDELQRP